MAATVSSIQNFIMGNKRVHLQKVTFAASSATADVATSLYAVEFAIPVMLTGGGAPTIAFNSTVAGTATAGTVALTSGISATSMLLLSFEGGKES